MKKILILLIVLNSCSLLGQEKYFEVSGRVLDAEDKNPIAYAHVFIRGKNIGTSSNTRGEFLLKIPQKYQKDTLYISMLGYKAQKLFLPKIEKGIPLVVSLNPNIQELNEVVVSGAKMPKSKALMNRVFRKFKSNYSNKAYLLESYYRDYLEKRSTKSHILESAIGIYDPGFDYDSDALRMKIYQSKVTNGYAINYQEYYENNIGAKQGKLFVYGGNQLSVLNFNNPIRNFERGGPETGHELKEYFFLRDHKFNLDQVSYVGDVMLYQVEIKAKKSHVYFDKVPNSDMDQHVLEGEVWVRADNYAIQKFVYEVKINNKTVSKTEMEYQLLNGKMYPAYLSFSNSIEIIEDEERNTYMHHRELFINEVKTEKIPSRDTFQLFDAIDAFHNSGYMSDQSFWNDYNTIKLEED